MARVLACSGLSFNGFALVIDKVVRNCVVLCVGSWGEAGHVCKARVRPRREMPRTGRPQTNLERTKIGMMPAAIEIAADYCECGSSGWGTRRSEEQRGGDE